LIHDQNKYRHVEVIALKVCPISSLCHVWTSGHP